MSGIASSSPSLSASLFGVVSRLRRPDEASPPNVPSNGPAQSSEVGPNGLPKGDRNANPADIGILDLLREDFETHNRNLMEPGFWAVAVHRFGNWRMGVRPRLARAPLSLLYRAMFNSVNWAWGIDLAYNTKLGRRVRLWHHGGMVLSAREIGDDVHIRHNTTFGVAHRGENWKKPIIQDGADIGVGACILGDVTIGHDTVVGANSVVLKSCPPFSTVVGVPGHIVEKKVANGHIASPSSKEALGQGVRSQ
jgi:serine O-acetyltransferase